MNFADIENTWRSPHNQPSRAEIETMKNEFTSELRRRRRGLIVFLIVVFAALTAITTLFGLMALGLTRGGDDFSFTREWGAVIFLLLPWAAAVAIARRALRHHREHADPSRSIAESVRALLDENAAERARARTGAILHGVMLLVLPVVVWQLRAVGKAGDEILVPAFVVWPLIVGGILVGMYWHYRRKLLPRRRELEALLKSYE